MDFFARSDSNSWKVLSENDSTLSKRSHRLCWGILFEYYKRQCQIKLCSETETEAKEKSSIINFL